MKRRKSTNRRKARRQRGTWSRVWSIVRTDLHRNTKALAEQAKLALLWLALIICVIIFLAWR
jgi:hypothetical protein